MGAEKGAYRVTSWKGPGRRADAALTDRLARVEESLAHLANLQESILAAAGEGIYGTDIDGRITFVNPAAAGLLGYQPEELIGKPAHETIHHSHPDGSPFPESECRINHAFIANRTHHAEDEVFWRKDGTSFPASFTYTPLEDEGRVVGGVLVFRDITERKEAQERLAKSERDLREAQEVAHVGSWSRDLETNQTTWSDELFRIYGVDRRTFTPSYAAAMERVLPEDRGWIEDTIAAAIEHRALFRLDHRVLHPDGSIRWVEERGRVVENDGRMCLVGTAMDITDRVEAEAQVRESEERHRSIFENAAEGIYRSTLDGRILAINPAAARILGYPSADEAMRSLDNVRHCYGNPAQRDELIHLLTENGSVSGFEVQMRRTDGSLVWVELSVRVIGEPGSAGAFMEGMMLDISSRKAAEGYLNESEARARQELELQVAHMQKMEGLGQLAGGIAHDFNNVLAVIHNYAAFARQQLEPDNPVMGDIDQVLKASRRGSALTRQLLMFARKDAARPEVLDLNDVVIEMEELLRRIIGNGISVETQLRAPLPTIFMDVGQLEQVIMNLSLNARDAMPDGGRLTLSTGQLIVDDKRGRTEHGLERGNYVVLTVTDTGCGIPAEVGERVFEPFFTSKVKGQGTGLGLATVFGIVQRAGGQLSFDSDEAVGTSFHLYLPVHGAAIEGTRDEEAAADHLTVITGASKTVDRSATEMQRGREAPSDSRD